MCTRREPHPVLRSFTPEVFEELGNMGQAPTQHEMPAETTRCKECSHQYRRQRERAVHALSCCHGGRRQGFVLHNIFKGAPFIPSTTTGKGKRAQPRKDSIASETLLVNPTKSGHPAGGMSSGVHGNSWCDARECTLWLSESWKLHPSNGITISSAQSS